MNGAQTTGHVDSRIKSYAAAMAPSGPSKLSTEQQIQSIWSLGGLTKRQLATKVWNGINDDNLLGRASELAYNFILAIFPMLLFLLALFGLFASRGTLLRGNLLFYLSQALPPSAFQLLNKTIIEVTQNTGSAKLTFGIVFALWAAAGGMTSMMSTLNGAYQLRDSRSLIKFRAIAVGLTIAISILVLAAVLLVLVGGQVANFVGAHLQLKQAFIIAWKIVQYPIALFFVVFSFSLIYYFGPDIKEQHWYWITPGSVFGVLLWLTASFLFRVYLHFFNSYSQTYGSLGAAMILLVWFYVTGFAFLVGGQINAQIEHAAARHGHPEAKAPGEKAVSEEKKAA
ncbi:MAG: ribonuclease BN [Acidobacteria bacterium]|nr:MAG: ribonuclease BN [Acidobacteriota bacterium]